MISARGGFEVLSEVPSVGWDLHWYFSHRPPALSKLMTGRLDILYCGEVSAGKTPLSMHALQWPAKLRLRDSTTVQRSEMPTPDKDDIRAFAEELIGAYGSFYRQAQRSLVTPLILLPYSPPTSSFTTSDFFRPGSSTYRLLTDAACRLAMPSATLLFYWNILLWDLRDQDITQVRRFFLHLRSVMVEGGLEMGGTAESLFWVLTTDVERKCVVNPHASLLLARLLRVSDKVSNNLQRRLEKQLLSFLTGDLDENGVSSWQPEAFRTAVIQDLGLSDT